MIDRDADLPGFCSLRDAPVRDERAYAASLARVTKAHEGLVFQCARRMARRARADVDDCRQAGFLGLLRALSDFDPARGLRLSTYATPWIRSFIWQMLEGEHAVRKPGYLVERHRKIGVVRRELEAALLRRPTDEELAAAAGLTLACIAIDEETAWHPLASLDEPLADSSTGRERTGHDLVADDAPSQEKHVERTELTRQVDGMLAALPERASEVLRLRFEDELTLQQIGDRLGITKQRIGQIEVKALDTLRANERRKAARLRGDGRRKLVSLRKTEGATR